MSGEQFSRGDQSSSSTKITQDIKQTLAYTSRLIEKFPRDQGKVDKEEFIHFEDFVLWKNVRPFISHDFSNGHICQPPLPTSGIPQRTLENYLVEDGLLCLIGFNGQYIHVDKHLDGNSDRVFNLEHIPQPFRGLLIDSTLPMAVYYSNVVKFIENNELYISGRVNQALGAILNNVVTDYKVFFVQLEERQRKGDLTMHQLLFVVRTKIRSMELLSSITKKITNENARGGATLSILYEECENNIGEEKLVLMLLSNAVKPYFESLEKWINKGYLFDPYNEFMIVDDKIQEKNDKTDEKQVQVGTYSIKKNRVPVFLSAFSEKILKSGKYLNIVKQCQSIVSQDYIPEKPLTNKRLEFVSLRDSTFLEIIDEAYNYSSWALLQLLFHHFHIKDRFSCLKRYFLMEQGDFVVLFMDLCDDELSKQMDDVFPTRVNSLVEFALRLCCKGKWDTYKDDITVAFSPFDVTHEICKIHAIGSVKENAFHFVRNKHLTGFESVTLTLKTEWPLSLVFTTQVMSLYQLLFRLLLKCKRVERELSRIWLGDKRFKSLERVNAAHYAKAFHLRHKMLVYTQSLEYCLMEEIIEYYFQRFMTSLKKVKNVDDVLDNHWNFLRYCLDECLFKCTTITSIILRGLKVCAEFCEFLQYMRIYCMDAEFTSMLSPDPDIEYSFKPRDSKGDKCHGCGSPSYEFKMAGFEEQFDRQVLSMLKIVNSTKNVTGDLRIARFFHQQNFNGYYNRLYQANEESKSDGTSSMESTC